MQTIPQDCLRVCVYVCVSARACVQGVHAQARMHLYHDAYMESEDKLAEYSSLLPLHRF